MGKAEALPLFAFDEVHSVFNGNDFFRFIIRDLDVEFLFKSHNEFNNIKAVSTQVFNEFGLFFYFVRVYVELLHYDRFNIIK